METTLHRAKILTLAWTVVAAIALTGCAQHQRATSSELSARLAPFAQTRTQAIALVTSAKHAFDAPSQNQLMLVYTDLEMKSNNYAGFLVEATQTGNFDSRKNDEYAAQLRRAIGAFNVMYATLQSGSLVTPKNTTPTWLSDAWVAPFAQSVEGYWQRYHASLAASPQTVAHVTQQIKSETFYPNFEDIATERVR